MTEKLLYRVDEAARLCSISRSQMHALIAQGRLSAVRIGRSVRISEESLRVWISTHESVNQKRNVAVDDIGGGQ